MPPPYRSEPPRSIWATGLEQIANILTSRELRKQDALEREQAAVRQAEAKAERDRAFALQERSVISLEGQRKDQADRLAAADAKELRRSEEVDVLMREYATTPTPYLAARIRLLGGEVPTSGTMVPKLGTFEAFLVGKYGQTPTAAQQLQGRREWEAANRAPDKPDGPKSLTPKLKAYLEQFPTQGVPIAEARAALSRAWAAFQREQTAAGTPTDLAEASRYLTSLYTQDPEVGTYAPREPLAPTGAAPAAMPAPPVSGRGGPAPVLPRSGNTPALVNTPPRPPGVPPNAVWDPDAKLWVIK